MRVAPAESTPSENDLSAVKGTNRDNDATIAWQLPFRQSFVYSGKPDGTRVIQVDLIAGYEGATLNFRSDDRHRASKSYRLTAPEQTAEGYLRYRITLQEPDDDWVLDRTFRAWVHVPDLSPPGNQPHLREHQLRAMGYVVE
jgi:hypothetical protein